MFNQALLARQAWRLLTKPESLCAQVLKARYYPSGSLEDTIFSGNASSSWLAISHGLDLLKKGLIWRVGDGSTIRIHHDSWIPRKGNLRPLGQVYVPGITRVSDLLNDEASGWDRHKLEAMFTNGDVQDILQICVGEPGTKDIVAWNFTNMENFR